MEFIKLKWGLRKKIILFSLLISCLPFIVTNVFWFINTQDTLYKEAQGTIESKTEQSAFMVDSFFKTKIASLTTLAKGISLISEESTLVQEDILYALSQNNDIQQVTFVNPSGYETTKIDRTTIYPPQKLQQISSNIAFRNVLTTYQPYLAEPSTSDKDPKVVIAVPVLESQSSTLVQETITPENTQLLGVLIAEVSLNNLFAQLADLQIGSQGYVYVIDKNQKVLFHPKESNTLSLKPPQEVSLSIQNFQKSNTSASEIESNPLTVKTQNFRGNQVMTTFHPTSDIQWFVIGEQPISEVLADLFVIQLKAIPLFLIPLSLIFFLSFFFSTNIVGPIRELLGWVSNVGKGNFQPHKVKTGDELEDLAGAYAVMAQNVQHDRELILADKNTLSVILGSIGDGIVALDQNYNIIFFNRSASQLTSAQTKDIIGKSFDSIFSFRDQNGFINAAMICQPFPNQVTTVYRLQQVTNLNQVRTINAVISTLPPSSTTQIRYILSLQDVTREQELEKMKLDFVSMAAHELRTPLTAIRGYASILQKEIASKLDEEHHQFINRLATSADNLSTLIDNLLNVSRIEKKTFKVDLIPLDLEQIVRKTAEELTQVAKTKKQTLTYEPSPTPLPKVYADRFRITEVITNLVGNAIAYTPLGGQITINMFLKDGDVAVSITDTGPGIPKEALPKLFTKFFRVSGSLEQGSKGTGLGLYISKSIIEKHKGKIWVESEVGKGTTFIFTLRAISSQESLPPKTGVIIKPEDVQKHKIINL